MSAGSTTSGRASPRALRGGRPATASGQTARCRAASGRAPRRRRCASSTGRGSGTGPPRGRRGAAAWGRRASTRRSRSRGRPGPPRSARPRPAATADSGPRRVKLLHRHARAGPRHARGRRGQRRLGDVAGPVAHGDREGVVALGRRLGALRRRRSRGRPRWRVRSGPAAEAPHDVRRAVVGPEHADHRGPVLRARGSASVTLGVSPGRSVAITRRLGRDERRPRRHGVDARSP